MAYLQVYVCGAHSTGKTTLLNYIGNLQRNEDFNIKIQEEIGRKVVLEKGFTQEMLKDKTLFTELNYAILQRLCELQANASGSPRFSKKVNVSSTNDVVNVLMWDRCVIDALTYLAEYVSENESLKAANLDHVKEILTMYQDNSNSIFVVLAPQEEFLEDDGVRFQSGGFQSLLKFHKKMLSLLAKYNIEYLEIKEKNLEKRKEIIFDVIREKLPLKDD